MAGGKSGSQVLEYEHSSWQPRGWLEPSQGGRLAVLASGRGRSFCWFLVAIGLDVGQGRIRWEHRLHPQGWGAQGGSLRLLEPGDPRHVGIEGDGEQPPAAPRPAPVVYGEVVVSSWERGEGLLVLD